MTIEEINKRISEIKELCNDDNADFKALNAELDELEARKKEIYAAEAERVELRKKIANNDVNVEVIAKTDSQEENKMTIDELRNSPAYIDAYAEYLKRAGQDGADKEIRTLMSEQALDDAGTIPVPSFVSDVITTAWEREQIMRDVPVIPVAGDWKQTFEISATGATKHQEGGETVTEEELVLGVVTIVQDSWKKWIGVSKKVLKLRGERFIRYLYDEITHKIAQGAAGELIGIIAALPATATATTPSAQVITEAPSVDTVANAASLLAADVSDVVVIINRRTEANFKAAAKAANFAMDVFEGLPRRYTAALPAYADAAEGAVYMIVGSLADGARRTAPEGDDEVEFTYDPYTQKKDNIVEIQGEQYGGVGVIACDRFTIVKKPEEI